MSNRISLSLGCGPLLLAIPLLIVLYFWAVGATPQTALLMFFNLAGQFLTGSFFVIITLLLLAGLFFLTRHFVYEARIRKARKMRQKKNK